MNDIQFNVTKPGISNFKRDMKELLHPIITDALSLANPITCFKGICFSLRRFLKILRSFSAEQFLASKGIKSNNCVINFLVFGDTYRMKTYF